MNGYLSSMTTVLLSWVRSLARTLWAAATTETGAGFLRFVADHWLALTIVLLLIGTAIDWIVYLLRWRPQRVWVSFLERLRSRREPEPAPEDGRRRRRAQS